MVLKAALKNERHPEYGVVTLPFPIPKEEYDSTIQMLKGLDIGDAVRQDCTVEELQSGRSILQRLEGAQVNVDELDYLAKRLDSFVDSELAQFQGMACKLDLTDMKDLISLTFSCQRATVIADFSDLEAIGRSHYLNTHGGCASMEELEQLDGTETAILLMTDNEGIVTPYGVVYDNGMHLHHFESPEDEDKPFDMQKTTRMRARRSHKSFLVTLKKYTWHYVFILPGALALFFFAYVPMSGLVVAFEDYIIYKGPWESPWNNFENFSFLQDPFFLVYGKKYTVAYRLEVIGDFPRPHYFGFAD